MTIETATYINGLNPVYPAGTDAKAEGDDHIRLVKTVVKATFPNVSGAVVPTHAELNVLAGLGAIATQAFVTGGYAPLGGVGATGTWPISVTGNAGTASAIAWTSVTGKPTNVSAFTNDAGYITSVASVTWTSVTGKPTNVSYFTNDVAYLTTISSGNVTAALGYTPANPAFASAINATTVTATGLIYGRSGAGTGLGRITTTSVTGSPAGTAQGDLVLVF